MTVSAARSRTFDGVIGSQVAIQDPPVPLDKVLLDLGPLIPWCRDKAASPEDLIELNHRQSRNLTQPRGESRLARSSGADDNHTLHLCQFGLVFFWMRPLQEVAKAALGSDGASDFDHIAIAPIGARLRRRAGKCPQPETFVIDGEQFGKPSDRFVGIQPQGNTSTNTPRIRSEPNAAASATFRGPRLSR